MVFAIFSLASRAAVQLPLVREDFIAVIFARISMLTWAFPSIWSPVTPQVLKLAQRRLA